MLIKNQPGAHPFANGEFFVSFVFKGDRYGLNNKLVNDKEDPLVEFYDFDNATPIEPRGQFVARYNASSLGKNVGVGLDLHGGTPEWKVDGPAMVQVRQTCEALIKMLGIPPGKW